MQRRKITRTLEVTVESTEKLTVLNVEQGRPDECLLCERMEHFVSVHEAAVQTGSHERQIFRRVESGEIGFLEMAGGTLLVCLNCAGR
jgi:hypothetical protein